MKISYGWLQDFLPNDLKTTPEEVAELLTDSGLEVEGIEKIESVKGGLEGIVIGEVVEKYQHPNADRLSVTKVNVGGDDLLSIVCGAPNVAQGQKVVVATVGCTLYPSEGDSFKIKKSKLRGELSEGMLCAEDEIGLGESHDGIMVLGSSAIVGQAAKDFFNIAEEYVLEIGLTPNRADAMSHYGVARDLIAVYNTRKGTNFKLVQPSLSDLKGKGDSPYKIEVKDSERCPRYAGVAIEGLKVAASPEWLQQRLRAIGVRPINNVVDITNYVNHEMGQPLHAFDGEKISGGKVVVQTQANGTAFTTLDEEERKLTDADLMICNAEEGMCIAGVFGGTKSGVTDATSKIFLESAYFNPVSVRKTARRFGLNTDASYRFERGIDPSITIKALTRAANLITELAGGEILGDVVDVYPKAIKNHVVEMNLTRALNLIGLDLEQTEVKQIFDELEIEILSVDKDLNYKLEVPAYRVDVTRECDIAEEILRLKSFNSVPDLQKISISVNPSDKPTPESLYNKVATLLTAQGFSEAMSNSLSNTSYAQWHKEDSDLSESKMVKLLNPLSSELGGLRQTLLYSALENVAHNLNRRNLDLKLFELGKTYFKQEEGYQEDYRISLVMTGAYREENWSQKSETVSVFQLKEAAIGVLTRLGLTDKLKLTPSELPWFSNSFALMKRKTWLVQGGVVSAEWAKKFDIKQEVLYAEINWQEVLKYAKGVTTSYSPVSKFPAVRRDLSLLVDTQVSFEQIEAVVRKQDKGLLQNVNLFDVYEGKNLEAGKKSYAISMHLQDQNKTLTDDVVDGFVRKVTKSLETELKAALR